MAPIFAKDYNTIKSSPTKDRDDISFEDTKTNGYSIVRSAMLAVIIAIVAVVGVVTFHQSPSLSNGYDSSMSSMAVVHEDDGGDSNIDTIEFDKVLATANKDDTQMTVVDTSLGSEDDSDTNRCGNLNFSFQEHIPRGLRVSTFGCAYFRNGQITGQFFVTVRNTRYSPIFISNTNMNYVFGGRVSVQTGTPRGTLVASFAASSRGTVRIRMNWSGNNNFNAVEGNGISLQSF